MKLLILLICLSLTANTFAAPYVFYFDIGTPPFMYVKNQKLEGIYPRIVEAIAREMKIDYELKAIPWVRALKNLETEKIVIVGIYFNKDREKYLDFSIPIFEEVIDIFYHPNGSKTKNSKYQTEQDFKGMRVGTIRGWFYDEKLQDLIKKNLVTTEEVEVDFQNFEKLVATRIDLVLAIKETGNYYQQINEYKVLKKSTVPFASKTAHIAINKKFAMKDFISKFNLAFEKISKTPAFKKMLDHELSRKIE